MKPTNPCVLTINGGSSSIKFSLFEAGQSPRRTLEGGIELLHSLERRAGCIRWCSLAASGRTRLQFVPGSAMGWDFSASNSKKNKMLPMRASFFYGVKPGFGTRHLHGRRTHDCQGSLLRAPTRLKKEN